MNLHEYAALKGRVAHLQSLITLVMEDIEVIDNYYPDAMLETVYPIKRLTDFTNKMDSFVGSITHEDAC